MRRGFFFLIALFPVLLGGVEVSNPKQMIAAHLKKLEVAKEQEKSKLYFELAVASSQDQETDRAFFYFLEALKRAPKGKAPVMGEAEAALYGPALEAYLKQGGNEPTRVAEKLMEEYGALAESHPEYLHLNFLIAAAYANLGEYGTFFERFYQIYPSLHDSFLAYKAQGVLYLRLGQRTTVEDVKKQCHEEAVHYLDLASQKNPHDSSLYKILMLLAQDEGKEAKALSYIQNLLDHDVAIPRGDICFYVTMAVDLGAPHLGQEVVDKARALYETSKAITAAQDYLNTIQKK